MRTVFLLWILQVLKQEPIARYSVSQTRRARDTEMVPQRLLNHHHQPERVQFHIVVKMSHFQLILNMHLRSATGFRIILMMCRRMFLPIVII